VEESSEWFSPAGLILAEHRLLALPISLKLLAMIPSLPSCVAVIIPKRTRVKGAHPPHGPDEPQPGPA